MAVGLPFQIYIARVLGVEAIGIFSLLEGGVALVAGFVGFGIAATLPKFIPHHLEHREFASLRRLLALGFWGLVVAGLSVYVVLLLMLPIVERQWPVLTGSRMPVLVMGVMVPLGLLMFFLQQGLRGFHEIRYMVLGSSFLQLTAKVLLTVVAFAAGWRLLGYVLAVVASTLLAIIWMAAGLLAKLTGLPGNESSAVHASATDQAWYKYAGVQFTGSLVGLGAGYLDRFLLAIVTNASSVGVLAVIKQLQQLPVVFLQMFISVVAPMFAAAHARDDVCARQHLYGLVTDWVVKASAPLMIFLALYARPTLGLYGAEFAQSGTLPLCILVAAQAVNVFVGPIGAILNMSGHELPFLRIIVIQTALATTLLVVLTPLYGLTGIAVAMAVSIVFTNLAALYVAKRDLHLRWFDGRFRNWVLPLALTIITGIAGRFVFSAPGVFTLAVCLLTLYGVFYVGVLAQGLHSDDRELLRQVRAFVIRPTSALP